MIGCKTFMLGMWKLAHLVREGKPRNACRKIEERMIKLMYISKVEGERLRRPRKGWRDVVEKALSYRSLSIQEGEGHI